MDNENIRVEFVNGSGITGRYEPYSDFRYVDTRTPFDEPNTTVRGLRASILLHDEFFNLNWPDYLDSHQIAYGAPEYRDVFGLDEYEIYFKDGKVGVKKRAAPDFGEISPSQELNDFVNTLVRGE